MGKATLTDFGFCVSRKNRPLVTYSSRYIAQKVATFVDDDDPRTDSEIIDELLRWAERGQFDRPTFVHDGRKI